MSGPNHCSRIAGLDRIHQPVPTGHVEIYDQQQSPISADCDAGTVQSPFPLLAILLNDYLLGLPGVATVLATAHDNPGEGPRSVRQAFPVGADKSAVRRPSDVGESLIDSVIS